jgi:hypothetical protein
LASRFLTWKDVPKTLPNPRIDELRQLVSVRRANYKLASDDLAYASLRSHLLSHPPSVDMQVIEKRIAQALHDAEQRAVQGIKTVANNIAQQSKPWVEGAASMTSIEIKTQLAELDKRLEAREAVMKEHIGKEVDACVAEILSQFHAGQVRMNELQQGIEAANRRLDCMQGVLLTTCAKLESFMERPPELVRIESAPPPLKRQNRELVDLHEGLQQMTKRTRRGKMY